MLMKKWILHGGYVISIANNRVINENGPVTLGTFTIWGVTYTFEVGMTWEDFLNSEYNTAGFEFIDGEGISMESSQMSCGPSTIIDIHMIVADQEWSIIELEDEIINNYTYRNTPSASC